VTSLLLSELTSNTAVANLMGPIAIATAVSLGFSPVPVCVVMALCTSLAFMLPVSTPPNAITYSSGYIPITKMIKAGVILDIIGVFAITVPLVYFLVKSIMGV
jgi:sodium-dependent dicarboxylate transporter 2/3/5